MKELIELIVKSIVRNSDVVVVEIEEDENSKIFNITVDKDDKGKLIGNHGDTVRSIKNIIAANKNKEYKKIVIKVK